MTLEELQRIELTARIASLLAVPLLVAVFGWLIQTEVSEKSLRKEYVQLAVSILGNQGKSKEHDTLKEWAVQLLADNAPVKLPAAALQALRTGTALNPLVVRVPIPVPCGPLEIKRPAFPFDKAAKTDDDFRLITLLRADQLVRKAYIAELEAVLEACRGSLNMKPRE
jgi:hypothetical protein